MRKLVRGLTILLVISFVSLLLTGIAVASTEENQRTVKIVPLDRRYWQTEATLIQHFEEIQETSEVGVHASQPWSWRYATALFLMAHPNVKIDFETEKQWPSGYTPAKKLMTAMAAGEAPSYYTSLTGEVEKDIAEGYAADITDLVDKWEFKDFLKENWWGIWMRAWRNGRCYGVPQQWWTASDIVYRKDLFKNAGLFNEEGKPGPSVNWTMEDFRTLCLKLTDPKKKIWGFAITGDVIKFPSSIKNFFDAFGIPQVIPDKSGKYTWKSALDIPEVQPLLRFWYDIVWEDKSVLVYSPGESLYTGQEFPNGRIAISYWYNSSAAIERALKSTQYFAGARYFHIKGTPDDLPFYKSCGPAPFPVGPEGLRFNLTHGSIYLFNPSLNKDQLKAAFEFFTWMEAGGEGYKIAAEGYRIAHNQKVSLQIKTSIYPYPGGPMKEVIPEWGKITLEMEPSFPTLPHPAAYNLLVSLENSIAPLFDSIIHDSAVDLQKIALQTANRINKGVLNYKVEGQTAKNFQDYYTDLATFYKENFPEYYEKTFQILFENYYKVW